MPQTDSATMNEKLDLLISTAERLAMPFLTCQYRICRRRHRCTYLMRDDGGITCYSNLDPDQREHFRNLFRSALDMLEGRHSTIPATDPDLIEREKTAMAIVEAAFRKPRPQMNIYWAWKRLYQEEAQRRLDYLAQFEARDTPVDEEPCAMALSPPLSETRGATFP